MFQQFFETLTFLDDRPNRHEQAPIQIEKPPDSLLMPPPLPSPGPTSISIKEA